LIAAVPTEPQYVECTYNGFASPSSLVIRTKVLLVDLGQQAHLNLDAKEHAEMECTQEHKLVLRISCEIQVLHKKLYKQQGVRLNGRNQMQQP